MVAPETLFFLLLATIPTGFCADANADSTQSPQATDPGDDDVVNELLSGLLGF